MFTDPWFYGTIAGFGCFAYTLAHNITTGAAFKTALTATAEAKYNELKAQFDAWKASHP